MGCHKQITAGYFALQGELKEKAGLSNEVSSGITATIHASISCQDSILFLLPIPQGA